MSEGQYSSTEKYSASKNEALPYNELSLLRGLQALQTGRILGQGSRSFIYELPDLCNYVLQTKTPVSKNTHIKLNTFEAVDNPILELNIGQPVLKSSDEHFALLRRQNGVTYSTPFAGFFELYGIDALLGHNQPMDEKETVPYRKEYALHLKKIVRMPQTAYNKLVQRIQLIQLKSLYLDPCSLNILVDETTSSFNTIDHFEAIGPYENVLGIACALMDTMYVYLDEHAIRLNKNSFSNTVASDPKLIFLRQHILIKILIAALEAGLALPEEACPKNYFGFHQSSFDMDYVLQISGCQINFSTLQALWGRQDSGLLSHIAA